MGRTLGEGKFGVVVMAMHRATRSVFALKKIPKAMVRSHLMVEQLALEIRLQSCLNHKNVLGMYGFFDDATHLFIVLEYMEQGTLYSHLRKTRVLGAAAAAGIVRQLAAAVEYLHDRDIAHRDIKPENIVISNVPLPRGRTSANCATSAGPRSATNAGRPTAAPSTTPPPKYSRAGSTT
jgi:serine/threonine protein kinase